MKAILIGRHDNIDELSQAGIEVVGGKPRPVMFPATAEGCAPVLKELFDEATLEEKGVLLFQAIPNQLAVAIARLCSRNWFYAAKIGAVCTIPGPRLTAETQEFVTAYGEASALDAAVSFVNSRAKVEIIDPARIKVSVDPFSPFVMSHIQWFSGETSHWTLRGFFANHGLPMKWFEKDGDIFINEDDSNEYPDIWDGDEVCIPADDIEVRDWETLVVKKKELTTDYFHVKAGTFAEDITKAMDGIG